MVRSSTEAEYRAIVIVVFELCWINSLLIEVHIQLPKLPLVLCDNLSATYTCKNPIFHSKMKHLALDFFFVREKVVSKELVVQHIPSLEQLADFLTKPLSRYKFLHFLDKIGVANGSPILWGNIKDNNLYDIL